MSHQVFEEISQPPEYVGENQERGIFGWMEVHPTLNPDAELETFADQTRTRELWMAICRPDVYESVLTAPGGFSGALMNQFDRFYDFVRDNLGQLENLNQCWDYESFVQELTTVCIQSFQSAAKVYAELLEHGDYLTQMTELGFKLADSEKSFLKAIRATRDNH